MGFWFHYLGFSSWTTLKTAIPLTHSHGFSVSFIYICMYNWFARFVPCIHLCWVSFTAGTTGIVFAFCYPIHWPCVTESSFSPHLQRNLEFHLWLGGVLQEKFLCILPKIIFQSNTDICYRKSICANRLIRFNY